MLTRQGNDVEYALLETARQTAPLPRSLTVLNQVIRVGACESVKNIDHKCLQHAEMYL